jgi:hypothetical protein
MEEVERVSGIATRVASSFNDDAASASVFPITA